MKIHHATAKKAADEKIKLAIDTENETCVALFSPKHAVISHPDPKEALAGAILARTLSREYPVLELTWVEDAWNVVDTNTDTALSETWETVPTLAAVLEACEAEGIDPEAEKEAGEDDASDDEPEAKVVVAQKYKAAYAEAGHPNHCGDWLAEILTEKTTNADGSFSQEAFDAILTANGVEMTGKWAELPLSGQRGWQGRYRMNGRQKLERALTDKDTLVIGEKNFKIPADFKASLEKKYPSLF